MRLWSQRMKSFTYDGFQASEHLEADGGQRHWLWRHQKESGLDSIAIGGGLSGWEQVGKFEKLWHCVFGIVGHGKKNVQNMKLTLYSVCVWMCACACQAVLGVRGRPPAASVWWSSRRGYWLAGINIHSEGPTVEAPVRREAQIS